MPSPRAVKISIHALREEGDRLSGGKPQLGRISIHALREEGDRWSALSAARKTISIHALREEGDKQWWQPQDEWDIFLSTPSARRATDALPVELTQRKNFYPRPPRGGRLPGGQYLHDPAVISIHALREEGDRPVSGGIHFPVWISIHALREEGDLCPMPSTVGTLGISIHALREEGDPRKCWKPSKRQISIHALREEGDQHG